MPNKIWPNLDVQEVLKVLQNPIIGSEPDRRLIANICADAEIKKYFDFFVDTDDVDIIKTFKIFEFQIKFYNLDKVGRRNQNFNQIFNQV